LFSLHLVKIDGYTKYQDRPIGQVFLIVHNLITQMQHLYTTMKCCKCFCVYISIF